ncbi:hypothetical protein ABTL82_18760, partial [Acinetobacter baumannii]
PSYPSCLLNLSSLRELSLSNLYATKPCTSKNIDYQSSDINFGKFKYFQSMYSGEKTYQGFVTSSSSLKEISEKNAFPISKRLCCINM